MFCFKSVVQPPEAQNGLATDSAEAAVRFAW